MGSDGGAWGVAAETGWGPADMGAADFPSDPIDSLPIYESPRVPPTKVVSGGEGSQSSHVGSVEPEQSTVGIVMAVGGGGGLNAAAQADSATSPPKPDPNSPGWTNRVRVGRAPPDRTRCASWRSALEKSIREYAEKLGDEVIDPCLGTTFDSLGEAYDSTTSTHGSTASALGMERAD